MGWTTRGPLGCSIFPLNLNDGTMARTWSFPPGPMGASISPGQPTARGNRIPTPTAQKDSQSASTGGGQLSGTLKTISEFTIGYTKQTLWGAAATQMVAAIDVLINVALPRALINLPDWLSQDIAKILSTSVFVNQVDDGVAQLVDAHPSGLVGLDDPATAILKIFFAAADFGVDGSVSDPYRQQALHVFFGLALPVATDILAQPGAAGLISANVDAAVFTVNQLVQIPEAEKNHAKAYQSLILSIAANELIWITLREQADRLASDSATAGMADHLSTVATQSQSQLAQDMTKLGYGNEATIGILLGEARYYKNKGQLKLSMAKRLGAQALAQQLDKVYYGHLISGASTIIGAFLGQAQPQTFEETEYELEVSLGL